MDGHRSVASVSSMGKHIMFCGVCAWILCACGCEPSPETEQTQPAVSSRDKLSAIEKAVHLQLPSDVVVLLEDDGGGRDPEYGYYLWLLRSEDGFGMKGGVEPSQDKHLLERNPEEVGEWIQSLAPKAEIGALEGASSLEWESGKTEFRGDHLITSTGEYLCIQRFINNGTPIPSGSIEKSLQDEKNKAVRRK